jgi:hypothetical protein
VRENAVKRPLWVLITILMIAVLSALMRWIAELQQSNTRLRLANGTLAEFAHTPRRWEDDDHHA